MDQYKQYLAANVLNEEKIINHRMLSRALKVHSGLAKQMLYDFYRRQNAKRSGSVYATYIVAGYKSDNAISNAADGATNGELNGDVNGSVTDSMDVDGDSFMVSSPPQSSMPGASHEHSQSNHDPFELKTQCMTLCREEDLETVKNKFDKITSMYIYSLGSSTIKTLQILSDCNRAMSAGITQEDPLKTWGQYGIIQNPNTRRRTGTRPPPVPQTSIPSATSKPTKSVSQASSVAQSSTMNEPKDSLRSKQSTASKAAEIIPRRSGAHQDSAGAKGIKRENSNLLKAFSRSNSVNKIRKEQSQDEGGKSPATPVDIDMDDVPTQVADNVKAPKEQSDSEEDAPVTLSKSTTGTSSKKAAEDKSAREERVAKLKKMMDDDDDEVPVPSTKQKKGSTVSQKTANDDDDDDDNDEDVMQVDEAGALDNVKKADPEPSEQVTASNGRRRGRRKVMRKKTVQDEEGYLVTTEEPAWESFSEDEPEPKKLKSTSASTTNSGTTTLKKGGPKGQGSIMNFFGKK